MNKLIPALILAASLTAYSYDLDASKYPVAARVRVAYTNELKNAGNAASNNYLVNLSEEDKNAYFTQIVTAVDECVTNDDLKGAGSLLSEPMLFSKVWGHDDEMDVLDIRWSEAGVQLVNLYSLDTYRKAHRLIDGTFNSENGRGEYLRRHFSVRYTVVTNQAATTQYEHISNDNWIVANILAEQISSYSISPDEIPAKIKSLCQKVVPAVKMALRKQGKTFIVGDDGVNPVQEAIDQLTAAFQAPRLAGVKEWFATYYPDYVWIDPVVDEYTDEEVASLKDKVFYGQIDLTKTVSTKLLYFLGLDEYNAFIERYNH